jgi:PAS domain S-box-containing protein
MNQPPKSDAQEINGVLSMINQLGAATERIFNRLYTGLSRRSQTENERAARQRRRAELEKKIEAARRINAQNKQLRNNLNEREAEVERLYSILSNIKEGIIMQDEEGRIIYINNAARDLLGSQKNFWDSELGTLFEQYRSVRTDRSELTPLGEPTRIQVNNRILGAQLAAVTNSQGERLGTMIVLRDVTRDTLADRLKDQFVTAISHELKTPMTVIKGVSEVLLGHAEDQMPSRRLLETLSRNVDILDRMVVELLDVSEMTAGTFTVRENGVLLEPLLTSVVKGIAPEINKNRLDVAIMVRDVPQLRVKGDQQYLRWALGHLLQNSAHYTEPNGSILVTASLSDEQPGYIAIEVIDNGVGIKEKDLPHIFERFYRGDPRDTGGKLIDSRGLGQGLFIARTVAEAHQGYLHVRSKIRQGSVFTMMLPVMLDD